MFLLRSTESDLKMSDPVAESSYAVALRSADADLFDLLQGALNELKTNGTIENLKDKWIGAL